MRLSKTDILAVGFFFLLACGSDGLAGDPCDNPCGDAYLSVGDATGRLGGEVVVEVTGFTGCCIRGLSLGIGHDTSKLRFVSGEAGPFLVDHAGADLQFFARGNEDEGYVSIYAFLDISFPITVPSTAVPDNTVLAVLRYEVLPDAALGETSLENNSRTFGSPNPVSNVYSRRPGEPPLDPELPDGTVTILERDTIPPQLQCPVNLAIECTDSIGTVVNYPVSATDNGDPAPVVECVPPTGTRFALGVHTVRCTATDDSGNSSECEFTVTVADTRAPEISCPSSLRETCDLANPGTGGARVDFPLPVVTDACGGNVEVSCAPPSGGIFPLGVTTVICMARDEAGNISNCSFTVEVVDETPPVIECIEDIVLQCTSLDGAVVNYSPPQVATECAGDAVVVCDPPPGALFAPGTTTVRCRAVDAAGNSDSCTFEVTVLCADELRGDSNSDGEINISDVSFLLQYLYRGGSGPPCIAAADSNGNGSVNVVDVIFTLSYLFRGGVDHPDLLTCDL